MTASGVDEGAVLRCCTFVRDSLSRSLGGGEGVRVLGPAPLQVVRVNNRFRYRVTVSADDAGAVRSVISQLLNYCNTAKDYRGVSVYADIGPSD